MRFYQEAFLMAQICSLRLKSNNRPWWVEIEQELKKPFNAADYLSRSSQIDNPIMLHTKSIWHKIRKRKKSSAFFIDSASLWNNPLLRIEGKPFYWKDNGALGALGVSTKVTSWNLLRLWGNNSVYRGMIGGDTFNLQTAYLKSANLIQCPLYIQI